MSGYQLVIQKFVICPLYLAVGNIEVLQLSTLLTHFLQEKETFKFCYLTRLNMRKAARLTDSLIYD